MQLQPTCKNRRLAFNQTGFTLVELLVVIGIIALLIGILLPALNKARAEANRAHCLSNIRNMQIAQWNYITDNKGFLIQGGFSHGGHVVTGGEELSWFTTLGKYYGSRLSPRCKSDFSPYWEEPYPASSPPRLRQSSYGINAFLDKDLAPWGPGFDTNTPPGGWYTKINKIRKPAEVIQFCEMAYQGEFAVADHAHVDEFAAATTPLYPSPAIPRRVAGVLQINAHGGKDWSARANYGFLDGHAESLTLRDVFTSIYLNKFDPAAPQPKP